MQGPVAKAGAYHPIMLVNVVTAVHAPYARFLASVWSSLDAQSHREWTWLVQIDGPDKAVRDALEACGAATDPRVRVAVNGTSEGPAVTRNLALARADAPLIQNVDADDELEPGTLSVLVTALAEHPGAGFAVGHARDLLPDGQLRGHALPLSPGPIARGALLDAWRGTLPVHPAGAMWRRSLLLALGGWSALYGMEDTGLLMAASATSEGVLVDAPTLRYRKHADQTSAQPSLFAGAGEQVALIRQRAQILLGQAVWTG